MSPKAAIVLLVIASIGLAGCGESQSDEPAADGKLSRSELAVKADVICKTGVQDQEALEQPADITDQAAALEYFEQLVPLSQKRTDALAALVPDDEARADWEALVAAQQRNNELVIAIRDDAKEDRSPADDLRLVNQSVQKFVAAASKIGSKECAAVA